MVYKICFELDALRLTYLTISVNLTITKNIKGCKKMGARHKNFLIITMLLSFLPILLGCNKKTVKPPRTMSPTKTNSSFSEPSEDAAAVIIKEIAIGQPKNGSGVIEKKTEGKYNKEPETNSKYPQENEPKSKIQSLSVEEKNAPFKRERVSGNNDSKFSISNEAESVYAGPNFEITGQKDLKNKAIEINKLKSADQPTTKQSQKNNEIREKDLTYKIGGETKGGFEPPEKENFNPKDDDIIARQLREAAASEKNPDLQRKLWLEYRKYRSEI